MNTSLLRKAALPLISALIVCGLYFGSLSPKLRFGGDAVDFLKLGDSLTQGHGYTIDGHFNNIWPPVTPCLLAAGQLFFGPNLVAQKIVLVILGLTGLLAAYFLLKRFYEPRLAGLSVLLAAFSFPMLYWLTEISTEGSYLFFSMLALLFAQKAFAQRKNWLFAAIAGLLCGLAVLSRTVGISLIGGLFLYGSVLLFQRNFKSLPRLLVILVPTLLVVGLWYGYSRIKTGKTSVSSYTSLASHNEIVNADKNSELTIWNRIEQNSKGYMFIFSIPDASQKTKKINNFNARGLLSLAIMGLAVIGFVWHLFRQPQLAECYLLAYIGILLVFNWYDIRYIVPLLPLLFYYVGWTIQRFTKPVIASGVLSLLILANASVSIAAPPAKKLRSPDYQGPAGELYDATQWIKQNDPNAIVMCRYANMAWFWTRMKVEGVPLIADPAAMWQHLQTAGVTIVIVDPDDFSGVTGKYLEPALATHADQTELIRTFGQVRVFQIHP